MEEVVLFINESDSKSSNNRCRICHEEEEEEAESYFEAPCACSGTVKYAHRDCIQRWCDQKGNTICEICLQEYKPGYTTISKQATVTISLQITRRENRRRRRRRRLIDNDEFEFQDCESDSHRIGSYCRSFALIFSVILLIKHGFDVVYGTEKYPFTIFTILTLKGIGILLPILVILRTITAIHNTLRHQYLESQEETISSEEEEENNGFEDEEENNGFEDEEEQQRHLA